MKIDIRTSLLAYIVCMPLIFDPYSLAIPDKIQLPV